MEVKRVMAEPVTPPDTIDITGLTLREAGVIKYLMMHSACWMDQPEDIHEFMRNLYNDIDAPTVRVKLRDC